MSDKEVFIDAENQNFSNEVNRYEEIVLNQIAHCVKCLSREMVGGVNVIHHTKYGERREYKEDLREIAINSIWTLKTLLVPYFRKSDSSIEKIEQQIENHIKEILEQETNIRGKGKVKIKDIGFLPPEHPIWKNFIEFKLRKYKEMFKILLEVYNKNKDEIRKAGEE